MQSTAKRKATDDPHDFVVVPSDQVEVAPSDAEITDLLRAAARHRSETSSETPDRAGSALMPAFDTTFRATAVNDDVGARGTTFGRQVMRVIAALLLAIGIGAAALTWQTFGYAAKKALVKWAPKFALSASLPLDKLGLGAESAPANEPAVADATPTQAASPAETAPSAPEAAVPPENISPEKAAAGPAASSPDQTQLLQSMARDLANVTQEVEILKASIAELKANQQKLSDKASEQIAKPRTAPPRPPAAVRRPPPVYSPTPMSTAPPAYRSTPSYSTATQAAVAPVPPAAQPYVPPPPPAQIQPQLEPGFTSAPRPPMPVLQQ